MPSNPIGPNHASKHRIIGWVWWPRSSLVQNPHDRIPATDLDPGDVHRDHLRRFGPRVARSRDGHVTPVGRGCPGRAGLRAQKHAEPNRSTPQNGNSPPGSKLA